METEVWLPVVGFEALYLISDWGNVWSIRRKRLLKPWRGSRNFQVELSNTDGKRHCPLVHNLVLEAHVSARPEGLLGLHWDDDPTNNTLPNLRWGTRAENTDDSVRNGLHGNTKKTRCPQNHEYTEANTYISPKGDRQCRACARARNRRRRLTGSACA